MGKTTKDKRVLKTYYYSRTVKERNLITIRTHITERQRKTDTVPEVHTSWDRSIRNTGFSKKLNTQWMSVLRLGLGLSCFRECFSLKVGFLFKIVIVLLLLCMFKCMFYS